MKRKAKKGEKARGIVFEGKPFMKRFLNDGPEREGRLKDAVLKR